MAASHFFVGLSAGMALLAVPVLTLTPGSSVPQHVIEWIEGTPAQPMQTRTQHAPVNRPLHGYQPGDPTPQPETAPTLQPLWMPTPKPTPEAAPQMPVAGNQPSLDTLRWAGTGVIRSGGGPISVRRVPGTDSPNDGQLADGSPVLVSSGQPLQVGSQQWRAIRGLNGVVGWVPREQLVVDGEAPSAQVAAVTQVGPVDQAPTPAARGARAAAAQAPTPTTPTAAATQQASPRANIGGTDGSGVVLRNSPNDADRTPRGLMDGTSVTVLEVSGVDWVRVRADNGLSGWVPARYVTGGAPN